jgi:hypothetical protein
MGKSIVVGGEGLTQGTVWLAVAAYFAANAFVLAGRDWRAARVLWTVGCAACLAHIGVAMHFYHQWSHAAAFVDTARQTREAVGFAWGGGVYFNYVFALLWLVDATWWWLSAASRTAWPAWLSWGLHGYLAFIIFNATVVFESGPVRLASLAGFAALALLWGNSWRAKVRRAPSVSTSLRR